MQLLTERSVATLLQQNFEFRLRYPLWRIVNQHILIDCPRLVRCRAAILRLFSHIHLPLTLENLLGLHPSLSCQQQLIIRNALTTYLINCNLIDSIWIVLAFSFVCEQRSVILVIAPFHHLHVLPLTQNFYILNFIFSLFSFIFYTFYFIFYVFYFLLSFSCSLFFYL